MRRQGLASPTQARKRSVARNCTTREASRPVCTASVGKKVLARHRCTALPRTVHRFSTSRAGSRRSRRGRRSDGRSSASGVANSASADVASSTFRVFLKDGRALPAYGESAVVGDRVVFSLSSAAGAVPMARSSSACRLESSISTAPARYARAVRAAYFAATTGEAEYQAMTTDIATHPRRACRPSPTRPFGCSWRRKRASASRRGRPITMTTTPTDVRQSVDQFDGVIGQLRARNRRRAHRDGPGGGCG